MSRSRLDRVEAVVHVSAPREERGNQVDEELLQDDVHDPDEQAEQQDERDDRDRRARTSGSSGHVTFFISTITA